VERLLKVEDPAEPTEIVVHVNMLKEGWDVTNLYTSSPPRRERSHARGTVHWSRPRLPYGKRVGTPAVDRLTIVAHDGSRRSSTRPTTLTPSSAPAW
jgi:type III restriction enzyme